MPPQKKKNKKTKNKNESHALPLKHQTSNFFIFITSISISNRHKNFPSHHIIHNTTQHPLSTYLSLSPLRC